MVSADLAKAEDLCLWAQFTTFYDDPAHVVAAQAEAEAHAGMLFDGLSDDGGSHLP